MYVQEYIYVSFITENITATDAVAVTASGGRGGSSSGCCNDDGGSGCGIAKPLVL